MAVAASDKVHCYGLYDCKGKHACKGPSFKAASAKECLAKDGTIGDLMAKK